MKRIVALLILVLTTSAYAQEKPKDDLKPPVLTDVQKLQLQNTAQMIELWQLKAQQAAAEFEKAKDTFQKLIATFTPPGYVITDKLELAVDTKNDLMPKAPTKPAEQKPKP